MSQVTEGGSVELKEKPKVSVILPTYERARFVDGAIRDLLAQSLSEFELLVMDDGSTDRTAEVVKRFGDRRVRYVRKEHLGVPGIINAGLPLCQGQYVMICHDHDRYDPGLLRALSDALDKYSSAAFSHCGVITVDPSALRETAYYVPDYPELSQGRPFLVEHLLPGIASPVTALSMIRRSILKDGFLNPAYGGCADVELWMRLSTLGDVAYVKAPLIHVRERSSDSVYFQNAYVLSELAIRAKRSYLEYAPLPTRAAITATWRKGTDVESLWTLARMLESEHVDRLGEVKEFLLREGTLVGALTFGVLSSLPRGAGIWTLRGLRQVRRSIRKLKVVVGSVIAS
jgi:glycosyltransferase involved in cell wall biosynthesis